MWHKGAHQDAEAYLTVKRNPDKSIICQIDKSIQTTIAGNRSKLWPILSTIIFCGAHDLVLRGKHSDTGNVQDLYDFRVEAGDKTLENHLQTYSENARYTSHRIQNELTNICQEVIRSEIVAAANKSTGFSILADEIADIAGTEQLSLAVRFVEESANCYTIHEEFLGFVPLEEMPAF